MLADSYSDLERALISCDESVFVISPTWLSGQAITATAFCAGASSSALARGIGLLGIWNVLDAGNETVHQFEVRAIRQAVPEADTLALLGSALAGLSRRGRARRPG